MALPALRSDWDRTTRQPATTATSVVPPPMSTTKPPAPPSRSNPAPAAAATGSSISRTLYLGRRTLSAAMIDRRSTGVAPLGTHTRALARSRGPSSGLPRLRARRRNVCSMAAVASRSAMTPSRSGWITWMSCGSLSASASAAAPTAATLPMAVSMAIAVGSSSTMPRPATQTSVFTVPRSIATLPRKRMMLPSIQRDAVQRDAPRYQYDLALYDFALCDSALLDFALLDFRARPRHVTFAKRTTGILRERADGS